MFPCPGPTTKMILLMIVQHDALAIACWDVGPSCHSHGGNESVQVESSERAISGPIAPRGLWECMTRTRNGYALSCCALSSLGDRFARPEEFGGSYTHHREF